VIITPLMMQPPIHLMQAVIYYFIAMGVSFGALAIVATARLRKKSRA
jgi:hypothetical protein